MTPPAPSKNWDGKRRQHLQQLGSLGLLIGNANYQRNPVLRNPARDVQLLAQAFGARCAGCNGRLTTCRHG